MRCGLKRFLDLVYPRTCEIANTPIEATSPFENFSSFVYSRLVYIDEPACERCGKPLPGLEVRATCEDCLEVSRSHLHRARSAVLLNDVSRHLVVRLKYEKQRWIAPDIARAILLNPVVCNLLLGARVVPIPLAPVRLRERGFNQSLLIARALHRLAPEAGIEIVEALVRTRETPAQAYAARTRRNRMRNVRNAFAVPPRMVSRVHRSRLVLIDDVQTTGATFEAAATALHRAGAQTIDAIAFAHG